MFDIGFAELLLILVVGLLVLGPERLPHAVRTGSLWLGRLRRSFYEMKADIEREIGADDIKQQLHNETVLKNLADSKQDLNKIQQDLNKSLTADTLQSPPSKPSDSEAP